MVDATTLFTREGERSKIKSLMGRTPGILKSKFLSVLGNSNELLNGISNKLDITLSLSSTTNSEEDIEEDAEEEFNGNKDEDTIDMSTIDFESRRVKERRAHEEILSGRFRHPTLTPKTAHDGLTLDMGKPLSSDSDSSKSSTYSNNSIDSKSPNRGDTDLEEEIKAVNGLLSEAPAIDVIPPPIEGNDCDRNLVNQRAKKTSNSSTLTSLNDRALPSVSIESSDLRLCLRSESDNSVPSWASSISLDSQTEENVKEFMKQFVSVLFSNSSSIGLELKSEFGQKARLESGRLWFSRFVNAQRVHSKKVDETTFYSLVQYFAIILFECSESEDYSPAKSLMNMCFTFYHEIEVPGCEPYREYLFTYLRQQPIWHTLRFWNAAFFDALQCERAHRPIPKTKKIKTLPEKNGTAKDKDEPCSSGSSLQEDDNSAHDIKEDQMFQQNITFGQLGTFTCNMHAFGLSKDLCIEFLKKQSIIANLPREQEKLLRDNITRMYLETDKWGA